MAIAIVKTHRHNIRPATARLTPPRNLRFVARACTLIA
jgi:hypothetical protein